MNGERIVLSDGTMNLRARLYSRDNGETCIAIWFGEREPVINPQNYRYILPTGKLSTTCIRGWYENKVAAFLALGSYMATRPKISFVSLDSVRA